MRSKYKASCKDITDCLVELVLFILEVIWNQQFIESVDKKTF